MFETQMTYSSCIFDLFIETVGIHQKEGEGTPSRALI